MSYGGSPIEKAEIGPNVRSLAEHFDQHSVIRHKVFIIDTAAALSDVEFTCGFDIDAMRIVYFTQITNFFVKPDRTNVDAINLGYQDPNTMSAIINGTLVMPCKRFYVSSQGGGGLIHLLVSSDRRTLSFL